MPKYIKPKLMSLKSNSLIEMMGPCVTAGYLNVGAARRAQMALREHKEQIVICKIMPEKQNEVVRIG